jgi:hypothetical protein
MPSIVWGRHPQEAYDNPYEYEAQEQFVREASAILTTLSCNLDRMTMKFHRDDRSLEKATWMLTLDLVDALAEINSLLVERRHRIAFRLFRDVVETIDLLGVLHAGNTRAQKTLRDWYKDQTISHGESRQHIEEVRGSTSAHARRDYYKQLSKFTHRTYRALLKSFSLGSGDMLVPDTHRSDDLVSPQTLASGFAVLADLILQALKCMTLCGPLSSSEIGAAYQAALESTTVPRRFAPQYPTSKYE